MPGRAEDYVPVHNPVVRQVAIPSDLDLLPIFARAAPREVLFEADHHLSARGASLVARALADELERRLGSVE